MGKTYKFLAFDFGASSGRAMLAKFDGEKITLEEKHRFSNDPVNINGDLHWDVLRLFFEIKQGILKIAKNLLKLGINIEDIKKATGLSQKELQNLAKNNN